MVHRLLNGADDERQTNNVKLTEALIAQIGTVRMRAER